MSATTPPTLDATFDVRGKVVLVTGASSGLGKRFASVLSGRGARVGLAARRIEALAALAKEINSTGASAFATRLDVSDAASIEAAVAAVERDLGPIDILVNNSGISISKAALEQTAEDWDAVMNVNLRGAKECYCNGSVFLLCSLCRELRSRLAALVNRSDGRISYERKNTDSRGCRHRC